MRAISIALVVVLIALTLGAAISVAANLYFELTFKWGGDYNHAGVERADDIRAYAVDHRGWRWLVFGLFLVWVWKVFAKLRSEVEGLTYTPGRAVAAFLVPFANLWKPLAVLRELWRASERRRLGRVPWQAMPAPFMVRLFYVCWIGVVLFGFARWWAWYAGSWEPMSMQSLAQAIGVSDGFWASVLLEHISIMLAGVSAAFIVWKVTRLAEEPIKADSFEPTQTP